LNLIKQLADNSSWGEATLEGHTQAVEGTLDALIERFVGYDAEYDFFKDKR
jgi:galactonate dehydratase